VKAKKNWSASCEGSTAVRGIRALQNQMEPGARVPGVRKTIRTREKGTKVGAYREVFDKKVQGRKGYEIRYITRERKGSGILLVTYPSRVKYLSGSETTRRGYWDRPVS